MSDLGPAHITSSLSGEKCFMWLLLLISVLFSTHTLSQVISSAPKDSIQKKRGIWQPRAFFITAGVGAINTEYLLNYGDPDMLPSNPLLVLPLHPLHGKLELRVSEQTGLGLNVNYSAIRYEYGAGSTATSIQWSIFSINARANYHFLPARQLDPYFGLGMGLRASYYKWVTEDGEFTEMSEQDGILSLECTLGLRFSPFDFIGFYVEAGLARSLLQGGIFFNPGALRRS